MTALASQATLATRFRRSGHRAIGFDQLEEKFTLLNHAQFTAGAFLQGIQSLAQILDLRLHATVAGLQPLDLLLLSLDLPAQGGDLRQAALPYPEAILQPA